MILSAHQPTYLTYPGTFDKMDQADIFVVLDDVQYEKNGWQNRNRLRTKEGWQWLTIPVSAAYQNRICDVFPLQTVDWYAKHHKTISQLYSRSLYKERLWGILFSLDRTVQETLSVINYRTMYAAANILGIFKETILCSSLQLSEAECATPDLRLISLCKRFGCDTYLSGPAGRNYINLDTWKAHGIAVRFQEFHLHPYKQLFPGWVENLSIVDLLLCVENPLEHIRKSRTSVR